MTTVKATILDLRNLVIRQAITEPLLIRPELRVPVHMIESINKLNRMSRKFMQKLGREPHPDEIADALEYVDKVKKYFPSQKSLCRSIDHLVMTVKIVILVTLLKINQFRPNEEKETY